jgi:hypothetical protein
MPPVFPTVCEELDLVHKRSFPDQGTLVERERLTKRASTLYESMALSRQGSDRQCDRTAHMNCEIPLDLPVQPLEATKTGAQLLDGDASLKSHQRGTEAEVGPVAESDTTMVARHIETFGLGELCLVVVGRAKEHEDHGSWGYLHAAYVRL